jgi:hypothetical protein
MRELAKAPKTVPFELVEYPKGRALFQYQYRHADFQLTVLKTPPMHGKGPWRFWIAFILQGANEKFTQP